MKRTVVVLAAAALFALGWLAFVSRSQSAREAPRYQGWIEADTMFIGPEDTGRIATLSVVEGQDVAAGDPLFAIGGRTQEADLQAAREALDEARSRLERLLAAQQRPEEIAILQAALQRAEATLDYARQELGRAQELVRKGIASQSRADQAQSSFDQSRAAAEEVQRQIAAARLGARREDLDTARSVVGQAEARMASAQAKLDRLKVVAPEAGRVQEIYFRPGEIVPAMRPVVSILPPGNLKVRFFVPQAVLPKVSAGQTVGLRCDGCVPGLTATVLTVGQQAEYTPPVIYTLEERRKLVFRVEARPGKPDAVRVGQPVTVTLDPAAETGDAVR